MDNAPYVSLARQTGLERELQVLANNIANMSTTGYRREGVVFAEYVSATGAGDPSLSIADAHVRRTDYVAGALAETGGRFDFAIEGDGFFLIETADGDRLTRAGAFTPNAEGELVDPDGNRLLDIGGAPIFVPPDAAEIHLAADGTLSAGGVPLSAVAVVMPADPAGMQREDGVRFAAPGGHVPVDTPRLAQGFLEASNVAPLAEITRLIEVQRGYEAGQKLADRDDERMRALIRTIGQT